MEKYTHTVTGNYILNEQIIELSGRAKANTKAGDLELVLTETYTNKTYTLTGDIINTGDFTIIDIIETNTNSDGPLIMYNVLNPSESIFEGRYDGERSEVLITKPSDEDLEELTIKELVDKTLKEGMLKQGRPATLYFKKIKK